MALDIGADPENEVLTETEIATDLMMDVIGIEAIVCVTIVLMVVTEGAVIETIVAAFMHTIE